MTGIMLYQEYGRKSFKRTLVADRLLIKFDQVKQLVASHVSAYASTPALPCQCADRWWQLLQMPVTSHSSRVLTIVSLNSSAAHKVLAISSDSDFLEQKLCCEGTARLKQDNTGLNC